LVGPAKIGFPQPMARWPAPRGHWIRSPFPYPTACPPFTSHPLPRGWLSFFGARKSFPGKTRGCTVVSPGSGR